jgi:uncharacterized membrane protein (DUF4010 family)
MPTSFSQSLGESMPLLEVAQRLLIALLCGALIGLEREFVRQREGRAQFTGVRTMMLIALTGALATHLSIGLGWWIAAIAFVAVAALLAISYRADAVHDPGMTTEVAGLVTFLLGAMIATQAVTLAVATAIVTTLILSLKTPLHEFARRISEEDLHATLKFAIITFVVLPFLPNRTFGPYAVLNPWEIWLMVVLISGISFAAYILNQLLGERRGMVVAALLGGLVSSTAVTLAATQRSREDSRLSPLLAASALLASAVMIPRVFVVLAVVQPALLPALVLPATAMALVTAAACVWLLRRRGHAPHARGPHLRNPFALGAAVQFGLIFTAVSFVAKVAEITYGGAGLYVTAALSGIADVDAITLSIGKQVSAGTDVHLGARAILLALMANTVSKAALVWSLGARPMAQRVLLGLGAVVLAGAVGFALTR